MTLPHLPDASTDLLLLLVLFFRVSSSPQKNEKTLQAQALAAIQRYNVIMLSGTPTQNNTHEIYSLLHFLLPRIFVTSEQFDRCFNLSTNSIDQEQVGQQARSERA